MLSKICHFIGKRVVKRGGRMKKAEIMAIHDYKDRA
jgi:hypothetical protein